MAMPIVSWWTFVDENDESQGITPLSQWNTGTIIAGETTAQKKIIVWNNKGGSTGVSSMKDCELGVVGQNGEIVGSKIAEGKWVQIEHPIGTTPFRIGGDFVNNTWVPVRKPIGATNTSSQMIEGNANDGTMETAGNERNYAKFIARMVPPDTATPGPHQAKLRLYYNVDSI
mgnify:CR=1 FL=1